MRDENGDGVADVYWPVTEDLWIPNGVAFHQASGALFVATIDTILRYDDVENPANRHARAPSARVTAPGQLRNHTWHGWRYLRVHRDQLYIAIGVRLPGSALCCADDRRSRSAQAPCNVPGDEWDDCLVDPIFGT